MEEDNKDGEGQPLRKLMSSFLELEAPFSGSSVWLVTSCSGGVGEVYMEFEIVLSDVVGAILTKSCNQWQENCAVPTKVMTEGKNVMAKSEV